MLLRMQERLHKENQRRVAVMQFDLRVAKVTHSFQLNCFAIKRKLSCRKCAGRYMRLIFMYHVAGPS